MKDTNNPFEPLTVGCNKAIVAPDGSLLGKPNISGEGGVIAGIDFTLIDKRKQLLDSRGHNGRPDLLRLMINRTPYTHIHESFEP